MPGTCPDERASGVKFGLYGFHRSASVDDLTQHAALAERSGFESVWVGDHVVLPRRAPGADRPRLEALAALAFLAASTTSVRLGAGVIVLPQRHPVLLAQQLATIDRLSAGRLIVGVGVGYVRSELAAFGVRLDERARRTDEYLEVLDRLWSGVADSFDGEFVRYTDVIQRPLPHRSPRPRLLVGGHVDASFERAIRRADGWFGWNLDPAATRHMVDRITELHRHGEGIGDAPEITVAPSEPLSAEVIEAYRSAGVDRLVLAPGSPDGGLTDGELTADFIHSTIELIARHAEPAQ